jgi:hypothetical protein
MQGFQERVVEQQIQIERTNQVVPVPVTLDPLTATAILRPVVVATAAATAVRAAVNTQDASRGQSFSKDEVATLPLGSLTLIRTFDQLAQLAAGVAPPPQTLGSVAGPGQGPGVGSAGQFSVNGLRSRANNFTVDGSDNNDEDIGVRRQGFVALVPQPVESIEEYQITTLLAQAQFGRNLGAQVNAVSKSGGKDVHGALYGFFNSSHLNARNFFDTDKVADSFPLQSASGRPVLLDGRQIPVQNNAGGEDSFTLGKFGATLGGPLVKDKTFYFLSAEGQIINATQEESFVVPTVEQRGAFESGATGITKNPFDGVQTSALPTTSDGAAIFSLFPFPNNPTGIYGANTFTKALPAGARGHVLSVKLDHNFKVGGRRLSAAGRYNYTNDRRDIPVTGGALFSSLQPRVRAQNFSFFLNNEPSAANAASPLFNQLRLSYGRTRLAFRELRDTEFLKPSICFPQMPFLLNAEYRRNITTPSNQNSVDYKREERNLRMPGNPCIALQNLALPAGPKTTEEVIGALGQLQVAGFSPIGADVFNFPQRRVNNTYQLADQATWIVGAHNLVFGADVRRTELNSDLPRNARPLVTFQGGPRLIQPSGGQSRLADRNDRLPFINPADLAAIGAASGFFITLAHKQLNADIGLRFHQTNAFAQDTWRAGKNLTLSFGLRYEYNSPPREMNRRIENTFDARDLSLLPTLSDLVKGRERIFEPDRNNFAPRVNVAYASHRFGQDYPTIFRGGYGLFYDQILGAVVSQSRSVFPSFLTLNFAGLFTANDAFPNVTLPLRSINPVNTIYRNRRNEPLLIAVNGQTVYQINPQIVLDEFIPDHLVPFPNAFDATLPTRRLDNPLAHHYSAAVEQQIGTNFALSLAYVGTLGRNLLRFTTPNSGPGVIVTPVSYRSAGALPVLSGRVRSPARSAADVGAVTIFDASANSRYDALQLQFHGRFRQSVQYQASYTYSHAIDEVSDVFDLAGAFALPQRSCRFKPEGCTYASERGDANFDARHRLTYYFVVDLGQFPYRDRLLRALLGGLQIAGAGQAQTGQPFTVNSLYDINLDGNPTDRLNTLDGLIVANDRRQPLRLITRDTFGLLAPFGQDGRIGRNTFRAGGQVELDLAVIKSFTISPQRQLLLRVDFFNFINRTNFGIPVRLLEAIAFGQAVSTLTPGRRIQLALKFVF